MRNTLINSLMEYAQKNKRFMLLSGDLGYGALDNYIKTLPEQFINCGIAEQNMTSVAAGMALAGNKVFTYSIGNFNSLRCLEQIRNDICYHNLDVKIISIGAGMAYGPAGITHHLTEDISVMRSIPNLKIFSPSSPQEAKLIMKYAYEDNTPCYIRIGKGNEPDFYKKDVLNTPVGDLIEIESGERICILSTGSITYEGYNSIQELKNNGINVGLYSAPCLNPINKDMVCAIVSRYNYVITIEENVLNGGFGSSILEILSDRNISKKIVRIGINNEFTSKVGDVNYLRDYYKLNKNYILKTIYNIINEE